MIDKNISKAVHTENALANASRGKNSTWMYWQGARKQYFVTAYAGGLLEYWSA